ncbi:MAG: TonB-dependent receptor, partial [Gammaproteobacteria bacterium]|nr:TonB-dependent receptor [Gammaproteobacteria bacterium]
LVVDPALYLDDTNTAEFERPYTQLQFQYMNKVNNHQIITGLLGFSGNTMQENLIVGANAVDRGAEIPVVIDALIAFDNPMPSYDHDISFISAYIHDSWKFNEAIMIEAAVYFDKMENADAFSNTTWDVEEIGPRLGLIWNASTDNTLRLSAFKYVLPFVTSRLDPVGIAGIPIFRNTDEGTIIEEIDLVWEYETEKGLVSFGVFSLDKESPPNTIGLEGQTDGVELTYETLLTMTTGLSSSYKYASIETQSEPSLNRDDQSLVIALHNQQSNGFSIGIKNTYRVINFEDGHDTPDINILDADITYEFDDKAGEISLKVKNILDEEFNWVTDNFVITGRNPEREYLLSATVNF